MTAISTVILIYLQGWTLQTILSEAFLECFIFFLFNIESALRVDSEGAFRIQLAQRLQVTSRFGIFGDIEYDTEYKEEWLLSGKYTLLKNIALTAQYHSDFGAGMEFRY